MLKKYVLNMDDASRILNRKNRMVVMPKASSHLRLEAFGVRLDKIKGFGSQKRYPVDKRGITWDKWKREITKDYLIML